MNGLRKCHSGQLSFNMNGYSDAWYSFGLQRSISIGVSTISPIKIWIDSLPCECKCAQSYGGLSVIADVKENMFAPSAVAVAAAIVYAPQTIYGALTTAAKVLADTLTRIPVPAP